MAYDLVENCLEALIVHLPRDSGVEMKKETRENGNDSLKPRSQTINGNVKHSKSVITAMKSPSSPPFCGLIKNFCTKNDRLQISTVVSSTKNGHDELPVFCVAAVLVRNRQKIIKEARSIDDFIKLIKSKSPAALNVDWGCHFCVELL